MAAIMENNSERRSDPAPARSFSEALERFRPLTLVSDELGLSYHTVWAWKARNWVEPGYWGVIGRLAERLGIQGVTEQTLSALGEVRSRERMAARKQRRDRASRSGTDAKSHEPASFQAFAPDRSETYA
jgi:hypothetical protein